MPPLSPSSYHLTSFVTLDVLPDGSEPPFLMKKSGLTLVIFILRGEFHKHPYGAQGGPKHRLWKGPS